MSWTPSAVLGSHIQQEKQILYRAYSIPDTDYLNKID
uniref:Uncharacterized protein n=1 Tax=Arundo donax TaxID=35708 RepID=A0A0A8ZV53_ARUDO